MLDTYIREQDLTKHLEKHSYFKKWFGSYALATDIEDQYAGIDIKTQKYGNIDIKYHFYEGENVFVELHNKHEYENSYTQKKATDYILYVFLGANKAVLIDYEQLHTYAHNVEAWHRKVKNKLTEVGQTGTTGILVPVTEFDPEETFTFRRPNETVIRENKPGFLGLWFKFHQFMNKLNEEY